MKAVGYPVIVKGVKDEDRVKSVTNNSNTCSILHSLFNARNFIFFFF